MQREIKFRGKPYSGEWVYGNLIHSKRFAGGSNEWRIHEQETGLESDIFPETVGQFTGLKDKNGVEIYEGDIIPKYTHYDSIISEEFIKECKYPEEIGQVYFEVVWNKRNCAFEMILRRFTKMKPMCKIMNVYSGENSEVIGNIHENSELLTEK